MALASSQSAAQILADGIGAILPRWLLAAAIYLPTKTFAAVRRALYLADRLGKQIVQEKIEAAEQGLELGTDVYSVLLHLNNSENTNTAKVLRPEEIADQTAVLLLAGQDTTANTLAFGLLELAKDLKFQDQLRAEIHSTLVADGRNVAYDSMPLLNAFIKEALRIYPAEAISDRVAVQDMVIPLAENITTSTGERMTEIPIQKGQLVTLAIASYQRLESRWGGDAHEFRPSRWIEGTPYKGEAIGPYAGLLTFLGGPHTCLGWRFAILEMQVIICELVGKFEFTLSEEGPALTRFANTLLPTRSGGAKGATLCIRRIL
ncbi:cytochrome P450 [Mycena epipterygia]|nr:cytochrome P450 [Mycena epipterygia]